MAGPNDRQHPPLADLLAQVPLTVSPFVTLPTAATLPYTYKSMPSTLPPPSTGVTGATATTTGEQQQQQPPKYVVSASGHAAHPSDIIASCQALAEHINRAQRDADRELEELEERINAHKLAEKRRLAPGWLDSDARLLEPQRKSTDAGEGTARGLGRQLAEMSIRDNRSANEEVVSEMAVDQGEELDRAFGGAK